MFGSKDQLPLHRGGSSPGIFSSLKLPQMSFETALSVAWAGVSLLLLLGGALHCYAASQHASLVCAQGRCSLRAVTPEGVVLMQFDKQALVVSCCAVYWCGMCSGV